MAKQHYYAFIDTGVIVPLGLHDSWESASAASDAKYQTVWIMGVNDLLLLIGSAKKVLAEQCEHKRHRLREAAAFVRGVREFRSCFTKSYDNPYQQNAYDWGREYAHRWTFRRYEQ